MSQKNRATTVGEGEKKFPVDEKRHSAIDRAAQQQQPLRTPSQPDSGQQRTTYSSETEEEDLRDDNTGRP